MMLSSSQQIFKAWVEANAPEITYLWNWNDRSLDADAAQNYLNTASHGQSIMCRFAIAVWFGQNRFDFDVIEAAGVLDAKKRSVIANWFIDPFWP